MQKKTLIQFFLLLILFSIIIFIFIFYFYKEKNIDNLKKNPFPKENVETQINNETGTLINDISYIFSDSAGNKYELFAEIGEVDLKNSIQMFLTNVEASIYLKNSSPVKIFSKYANYNIVSHETNFIENVRLFHFIH